MLPGLFDDERAAIRRAATMLIAGSLAVLPLTAQHSLEAGAAAAQDVPHAAIAAPPPRMEFPAFEVERDPFVPVRVPPSAQPAPLAPAAAAGPALVRAIVTGSPTRALIDEGGSVRIVGPGDRLGDLTILSIARDGIELSDGSHLPLAQATP
jgi:hypothetical protein